MSNTAIQLYVLREDSRSVPDLVRTASSAGFEGVEFAFRVPDADQDAVRDALDETGTEVAGAHVPIGWLEDEFDETLDRYLGLGCDTMVVPSLDESCFESESAVADAAHRLTRLAERLDGHGVQLCYHNHSHEFVRVDGRWAFDVLVENAGEALDFQLDLPSAQYAGADPVALLDRVGQRTRTVHFYDRVVDTKASVAFGNGDVELADCIDAAKRAGVDWIIYEGDYEKDTLEGAATTITELLSD